MDAEFWDFIEHNAGENCYPTLVCTYGLFNKVHSGWDPQGNRFSFPFISSHVFCEHVKSSLKTPGYLFPWSNAHTPPPAGLWST